MRIRPYKSGILAVLLAVFFTNQISVYGQYYDDEKLKPDFSAGFKTGVCVAEWQYAPRYGEMAKSGSPVFQPTIRYDFPIRLWTIRDKTFWLSLTASTGVLHVPVKKINIDKIDLETGNPITYSTKSPSYIPFYFGFYTPGPFGLGVEAFYAKGINGVSDIWGGKLLGISYNHEKFRINAAYEMAVPVKFSVDNPIQFISLDFLWKLGKRTEY
mgnify:CR=1 FL=1